MTINDSLVLDYDNDDHTLSLNPYRDAGLSCRGPLGPPLSSIHTSTRSTISTMDPQVEDQQQQEIIVLKVSLPSSRFNYTRLTLHQSIYEHDFIDVPPPKAWKVGRGRPEVHHTGADVAPPLRPLPDCPNSRFESLIPIPSTQRRYTSICGCWRRLPRLVRVRPAANRRTLSAWV